MHRVFIATDDASRPDYWLHHPRSVRDLEAMGEAARDGARVTLYGTGAIELSAVLHFQAEVNCWIAYPASAVGSPR